MATWIEELHVPHFNIPITGDDIYPVLPASPILAAPGDGLYLSNLDDMIGVRVFTPTVYFYRSNSQLSDQKPVTKKLLREAPARVLVQYYPFSGRLRETENGKLEELVGPEQGALMVEVHCELTLSNLGDLAVPNPSWTTLIYRYPHEEPYKVVDMALLIAQVTRFRCGGGLASPSMA